MNETTFTLRRTDSGRKTGRFLYEVLDASGKVIDWRRSDRHYVAAGLFGSDGAATIRVMWGRPDLVGKGLPHYMKTKPHHIYIAHLK